MPMASRGGRAVSSVRRVPRLSSLPGKLRKGSTRLRVPDQSLAILAMLLIARES